MAKQPTTEMSDGTQPTGVLLVLQQQMEKALEIAEDKAAQVAVAATKQLALANEYVVDSEDMYQAAAGDLQTVAKMIKLANERRLEITRPIDATKTAIMGKFSPPLADLEKADQVYRGKMLAFRKEEDRKARELQAKAEAEEAERLKKLEAQAAKAKTPEAREKIEQKIEDVKDAAPMPVAQAPKAAGIASRKTWKVSSVDKAALIIACAKRLADGDDSLMPYLEVNASELATVARALKANTRIPGVSVEEVESLTVRS